MPTIYITKHQTALSGTIQLSNLHDAKLKQGINSNSWFRPSWTNQGSQNSSNVETVIVDFFNNSQICTQWTSHQIGAMFRPSWTNYSLHQIWCKVDNYKKSVTENLPQAKEEFPLWEFYSDMHTMHFPQNCGK